MNNYSGPIEDIFDQYLVEIRAGKRSASEFLEKNPKYRDEFEPLLNLTERLNQAGELKASEGFRGSSLARFKEISTKNGQMNANPYPTNFEPDLRRPMNQAMTPPFPVKRGKTTQRWNRISFPVALLATFIILFFFLSVSVVLAANSSLPGSSFYPMKLAIERTELKLSSTDLGDQQLHLQFAARRLTEVDRLLQQNRNLYINLALDNYRAHISPLVAQLETPDLTGEERTQLAKLILRSSSLDENLLQILYQRIPPEQRALIKQAIEDARAAREIAGQIVDNLPDLRTSIRNTLESTLGLSIISTTWPTVIASQRPGATSTPTPNLTNFGFPNPSITPLDLSELPYWLTNTPDWSQIGTLYPSVYPTLVNLATSMPLINQTLQPPVLPTIIIPTIRIPTFQVPTPMPIPPIPTFIPPQQAPTSVPIPQIPTPPVIPTR